MRHESGGLDSLLWPDSPADVYLTLSAQHHGQGPKQPWDSQIRETNIFLCESRAYRRLTQAGVCARGITPQFYGTIESIDPTRCLPYLKAFIEDEYPPTAILLEYIPDIKELDWTNYNERRMQKFVDGLNAIHAAQVYHDDVHPRNMMIVEGDPERAIWIDFDRAQTFNGDLTERQKEWIAVENELVAEMADFMVGVLCSLHSYALYLIRVGSSEQQKQDFNNREFDKTRQYYR
jgi:tRNA A-37 threonylcarbamoyl transferase component Bud32